jgi:16S rRNA (uracil1498-N3)-methyltransferase
MGERVILLDGAGGIYQAAVRRVGSEGVEFELLEREHVPGPRPVDLALSITRAHRFDLAVEKCTELGVRSFIPLTTERSVWRGGRREVQRRHERLKRKVIAACKQSGQPHFPDVLPVHDIESLLGIMSSYEQVYLADPAGDGLDAFSPSSGDTLGIVGPEGGFSPQERSALVGAGARPLSLGSSRLRSETAAICLLFVLMIRLGRDFR